MGWCGRIIIVILIYGLVAETFQASKSKPRRYVAVNRRTSQQQQTSRTYPRSAATHYTVDRRTYPVRAETTVVNARRVNPASRQPTVVDARRTSAYRTGGRTRPSSYRTSGGGGSSRRNQGSSQTSYRRTRVQQAEPRGTLAVRPGQTSSINVVRPRTNVNAGKFHQV